MNNRIVSDYMDQAMSTHGYVESPNHGGDNNFLNYFKDATSS